MDGPTTWIVTSCTQEFHLRIVGQTSESRTGRIRASFETDDPAPDTTHDEVFEYFIIPGPLLANSHGQASTDTFELVGCGPDLGYASGNLRSHGATRESSRSGSNGLMKARHAARTPVAEDFPGGPTRHRIFPSLAALVIFLLAGVLAPLAIGYLHISHSPQFSMIDEINHYDYVTRLAAGGFPRLGQDIQPSSIRALQCYGLDLPGSTFPHCDAPFTAGDRAAFAATIAQYEAQQPPTYYAVAVPLRWVAIHVFGFRDLTGTRIIGLLWLIAGLFCMWAAGRLLGLSPVLLGAGLLLISTSPVVMDSATIVSNDAADLFAGALIVLLGVLAWRRPWRFMPFTLLLAAFVVTSTKLVGVLPVLAVGVLFGILECIRSGRSSWGTPANAVRRWFATGGALITGGILSILAWLVASHSLSVIDPVKVPTWQVLRGQPNGFSDVLREAVTMLAPMTNSFGAIYPGGTAVTITSVRWHNIALVLAYVLTALVLAGALSGLFSSPRRWFHWTGLVTVATLFVGGVALGYSVHYAYKIDASLSGRYGLAMVPLLILGLLAACRGRWVVGGFWAFGVLSLVTTSFVILA